MTRVLSLISLLLAAGLQGLVAQVLPPPPGLLPVPLPEVDIIQPVPLPEIPLGGPEAMMPELPERVDIQNIGGGRMSFDIDTDTIRFHGPGIKVIGDTGTEIFADSAVYDGKTRIARLQGNISVYQGNILQRGQSAVYNFNTARLELTDVIASVDPVILESGRFVVEEAADGRQVFIGQDAGVTTHDVESPNYWLRASETRVYPGDKVTFRNLRVYAGETPVFWLPYLSQPLDGELGYQFVPGARTNWGPYLLNTYGIMLGGTRNEQTGENEDAWLLSRWRFDIRTSRGLGTGVDFVDTRPSNGSGPAGSLSLYYMNDLDPGQRRSGLPRGSVNEDRYRIELKHRAAIDFEAGADWYFDSNLTVLSDHYYLEDFEPTLYRADPAPDNTLGIFRRDDRTLASLFTRLRLNDFNRTDTRLPMLAVDMARGPLFNLPVLHEGTTSLSISNIQTGDVTRRNVIEPLLALPPGASAPRRLLLQLQGYERQLVERIRALPPGDPRIPALRNQLLDSGYTRFHTYQELSLPFTLGGWLNVVPQVGFGHTRYWAVDSPASAEHRTFFHAGTEASLKFSSDYTEINNPDWGLNGLLHVIQPYANWSVVSADELDDALPRIDRLTFTTRPRTLAPSRFTATDSLESWNIARLGVRNRLLTRRDGQSLEWLYVNSYMDAFLEDPELDRNVSNLYNDVRWSPLPWLAVELETQTPIVSGGSGFSEYATNFRFLPRRDLELSVGYRYLDNHPVLLDSGRVDLRAYARISENWGLGMRQSFEMDDGTLEVQQYTLHRDLGNWVAGFGVTHRDNRVQQELGLVFSLTLKDFPSVSLPFRIDAE